jgi:hypothetical protein
LYSVSKFLTQTGKFTRADIADSDTKAQFIDSLNNKIRELSSTYKLFKYSEPFTSATIDELTMPFIDVKRIKDSNGFLIDYYIDADGSIVCPGHEAENKTIEYYYYPDEVSEKDDIPIPERLVNPMLFCYFATFMYFQIAKKFDKAAYWLSMYQDQETRITNGEKNNRVRQGW